MKVISGVKSKPANTLPRDAFEPGDILIHHAHRGEEWGGLPFHCSLVGPPDEVGAGVAYDSLPSQGVRRKSVFLIEDQCVVFRPHVTQGQTAHIGAAAAIRAKMMFEAHTGYSDHFLGVGRAVGSVLKSSKFGTKAQNRLDKYFTRENGSPKNVFCSEYVILCYQLGCMDVGLHRGAAHWPNLDAKYVTPWNLESYLLRFNGQWTQIGSV
jgi:hypothetical protein